MNLDTALSAASGGLANVNAHMALLSQNIANASTPDYVREIGTQQSVTAGGSGMGVHTGATQRQIDTALQAAAFHQDAIVQHMQTRQTALQAIDAVHGTPGQGNDLPSLVGAVQDAFSALLTNPDNQAQQSRIVSTATSLAQGMNSLADAYATQRQAAHTDIVSAVQTLNGDLKTIGALSDQIVRLQAGGQSIADLENQRDAAVHDLSRLADVKTLVQANGDLVLVTSSGLTLPTRGPDNPFSITGANLSAQSYYPGNGIPGIMLRGADITSQITGGRIGAAIMLRDTTMPTWQAELDEFAQSVTTRFASQGLTLFTEPGGAVPPSNGIPAQGGYVGFAGTIQVNAAVVANPGLVRDGTDIIPGGAGGATPFIPNPPGGPAGFTTLIQRVLSFGFGAEIAAGVPQPAIATTGLGPTGTLATPYTAAATLIGQAGALVAAQSAESADATASLSTASAMQTSLTSRLTAGSGVSIDTEMSSMIALQNSYGANAKVLATIQQLFSQLLNAVQ